MNATGWKTLFRIHQSLCRTLPKKPQIVGNALMSLVMYDKRNKFYSIRFLYGIKIALYIGLFFRVGVSTKESRVSTRDLCNSIMMVKKIVQMKRLMACLTNLEKAETHPNRNKNDNANPIALYIFVIHTISVKTIR